METRQILSFVINLRTRDDRKLHLNSQFETRCEFNVSIIDAINHTIGAKGLWLTILKIVSNQMISSNEYILICEDDHQFTDNYSKELLFKCIEEAKEKDADILLGGVSSVHSLFRASASLLWIEGYTGNQFVIIFRKFFQTILDASFNDGDAADYKFSSLTSKKFLIYPFISIQSEFGYSDVTSVNNETGRVSRLFSDTSNAIRYLLDSETFYGFGMRTRFTEMEDYAEISIPTYAINLSHRKDRLIHIKRQFEGRGEFNVYFVEACEHEVGAVGLWNSIRKVISMAVENEDDVLIICEDDHQFTDSYSTEILIRNIFEAHAQGVDILAGGTSGGFGQALPVAQNRFWVNHFFSTQFIVIYKKFFQKILNAPFDNSVTADDFLSALTSNKMVIYPFISIQMDFGYSDVTKANNKTDGLVTRLFEDASARLSRVYKAYGKYAVNVKPQAL